MEQNLFPLIRTWNSERIILVDGSVIKADTSMDGTQIGWIFNESESPAIPTQLNREAELNEMLHDLLELVYAYQTLYNKLGIKMGEQASTVLRAEAYLHNLGVPSLLGR